MRAVRHITVREQHGIRRFLYPFSLDIDLAASLSSGLGVVNAEGKLLPSQTSQSRLDFALSLAPFETARLDLLPDQPAAVIPDPLNLTDGDRVRSTQQRFLIEFDRGGVIHEVSYDSVRHLRGPSAITRNGETMQAVGSQFRPGALAAQLNANGRYSDACRAETRLEVTSCKSWVILTHVLSEPKPQDQVKFQLPFAAASPVPTCDFGVGGGTYGKIQSSADIVWRSEFADDAGVDWSIACGGRVDYAGEVDTFDRYKAQRWFHLIDRGKALAVAVTGVPRTCREMTVTLRSDGAVDTAFLLGDPAGPAEFAVCYHFLNDIPPIAAATNPQSILLAPTVTAQ